MCTIRPLAAIRYSTDRGSDLSSRLSPPYDVLEERDKAALLTRDEHNFVALDLPWVPAKAAGPPAVYEAAQARMQQWLTDGTLIRDREPALYVYHQAYHYAGRDYLRKMFFARLKLEPFGQGQVFPHEQTFGGPKEDRLMLTRATRANLSPIFGLYQDAGGAVTHRLDEALGDQPPLACGTLDGVENRLWAVRSEDVVAAVVKLMESRPVFIADGHHRYGTGLLYRDWLAAQRGPLAEDHPANYVLCVLCAMEDPGLLILPTHRILPGVKIEPAFFKEDRQVEISHLLVDGPEQVPAALARFGPQALGMFTSATNGYFMLRPRDPDLLHALTPNRSPAWRKLALAFLHAYLLERAVVPRLCGGRSPEIHYLRSATEAVEEARRSAGSAFLMQATTMAELRDVCAAGDLMPQKSTFFYPKLASGLVINPLE